MELTGPNAYIEAFNKNLWTEHVHSTLWWTYKKLLKMAQSK